MSTPKKYDQTFRYLDLREIFQLREEASLDDWPAPGFFLRSDGIYVKSPEEYRDLGLLFEEVKALCEHPLGDYTKPVLPLPCTSDALYTFLEEYGCLDVGNWFDETNKKWVSPVFSFLRPALLSSGPRVPKQRTQEEHILMLIKEAGFSPTQLPKWKSNGPGVKAQVKVQALKDTSTFSTKSFELAWQRLRDDGRIAEQQ